MTDQESSRNLVGINSSVFYGTINHFKKIGLQYAEVPAIVGIIGACENVDTLFKVGNRLSLPLFFTQTGQLALEQVLQSSHGAYAIIHSGRDEEIEDKRHLRQFRLTEEEFDCTLAGMTRETYDEEKMFIALLSHIEKATKAMISAVMTDHQKVLSSKYKRDPGVLREIVAPTYLRIAYEKAINLLQQAGYSDLDFGSDLEAEHEAKIVELINSRTKSYGTSVDRF